MSKTPVSAWTVKARRVMFAVAVSRETFTNDIVRSVVTSMIGSPEHPNQWGGLYSSARAAGVIAPVGATKSNHHARNHGIHLVWTVNPRLVEQLGGAEAAYEFALDVLSYPDQYRIAA